MLGIRDPATERAVSIPMKPGEGKDTRISAPWRISMEKSGNPLGWNSIMLFCVPVAPCVNQKADMTLEIMCIYSI